MTTDKRSPVIRRRRYAIKGGQRQITGTDVEADFQEFHAPTSQLLNAHFSGPGVVKGLSVTGETGSEKVVVGPGVAVDGEGRLVVLSSPPANPGELKSYAHIGEISGGGGLQPAQRVEVPVDVPLASAAGKAVFVTIEHYEGIVDDGTPYDIKELQPWLRFRPLSVGNEAYRRRCIAEAIGEVTIIHPSQSGPMISHAEAGTIRAAANGSGLQIEVDKLLVDGDLDVSMVINGGQLHSKELRTDESAEIGGDLVVNKRLKLGTLDVADEIATLNRTVDTLRAAIQNQGRVAWQWRGGNPPTDAGNGSIIEFTFDGPVREATATVNHINLKYRGGDDHHIHRVFVAANVERIDGPKVFVRYRANFHDNGGNWSSEGGVEVIVVARLEQKV